MVKNPAFMTSETSYQWVCRTTNPFVREVLPASDVLEGGSAALPGVAEVNAVPLSRCMRAIDALLRSSDPQVLGEADEWGSSGRTVMVASPRAGYGKTHLLARLREATKGAVTMVPIEFDVVEPVSWRALLRGVLRHFDSTAMPLSVAGRTGTEHSLWQETGRRFFSEAYLAVEADDGLDDSAPLIDEEVLRREYVRAFAPETASKLRDWVLENSYHLGEAAAVQLSARWRLDGQARATWIDAFKRSTLEAVSSDERAAILRSLIPVDGTHGEAMAKARLGELLRMAATCRPLVLVVDHLDGFFGRDDVGMPLANIIAALRNMLRRSVTLLCLNQDVWESVFEGNVPSALIDRLSGESAALGAMSVAQAADLVRSRLHAAGIDAAKSDTFLQILVKREGWKSSDSPTVALYPRAVLRRASLAWERIVESVEASTAPATEEKTPMPAARNVEAPMSTGATVARETKTYVAPAMAAVGDRMTDLDAIVNDIRSGGARAVSEGPSGGQADFIRTAETVVPPVTNGHHNGHGHGHAASPAASIGEKLVSTATSVTTGGAAVATATATPTPTKPKATKASTALSPYEAELRRRVAVKRELGQKLPWLVTKLERLVNQVGANFPAVSQSIALAGASEYTRWTVRDSIVLLGFGSPDDDGFWRRLLKRAADLQVFTANQFAPRGVKVVVFTSATAPLDRAGWLNGLSVDEAASLIDTVVLHNDDLALLYAGDDMIRESMGTDKFEATVRFVARRMDPFWRRLTRPLQNS